MCTTCPESSYAAAPWPEIELARPLDRKTDAPPPRYPHHVTYTKPEIDNGKYSVCRQTCRGMTNPEDVKRIGREMREKLGGG